MINNLSSLPQRYYRIADVIICLPFLIVPLLIELPFRVNIFLSWEGAYRLYLGQVPFKDFGLPLGFGYWLIPSLFFHIFGPTFMTLVKSQVLINAISLLSVRGILYNFRVKPVLVTLSLAIFCVTYVIYNFWPWYNHSVVVYELAGIYFLTNYLRHPQQKFGVGHLIASAILIFLSFFTKQDGGAVGFVICMCLLAFYCWSEKQFKSLITYAISFVLVAALFIIPFINFDFFYWFNYGQPPHNSRLSLAKLVDVFFVEAVWEKIYLSAIAILLIMGGTPKIRSIISDKNQAYLTILSLGLIGQAIATRVSSPLPTDHMTYFHAFGFLLIASLTPIYQSVEKLKTVAVISIVIMISFSTGYWKYVKGHLGLAISNEDAEIPWNQSPWRASKIEGFEKVKMPPETIDGIKKLLASDLAKKKDLKVLNMSELTPLALNMDYQPLTDQPLWYHLNVGIFQREVEILCERVKNKEYDLVLFEDIPGLVHFYPYQVRDTLRKYYRLEDTFLAPRKLENSVIEVYVKGEPNYERDEESQRFKTTIIEATNLQNISSK